MIEFVDRVEYIRRKYPCNSAFWFRKVKDSKCIKPGMIGRVQKVDEEGIIYIKWQTGPVSKVLYGVDEIERLTISDTIKLQIKKIEDLKMFRMTLIKFVKAVADFWGYKELLDFLKDESNEDIYLEYVVYGML